MLHNNVAGTLNLLTAMLQAGVKRIIFSSSAAVYGEPSEIPIPEDHPASPTNPYGATKLTVEGMLRWFDNAHGLKYISLRYFNAAGADPAGDIGAGPTSSIWATEAASRCWRLSGPPGP